MDSGIVIYLLLGAACSFIVASIWFVTLRTVWRDFDAARQPRKRAGAAGRTGV